MNQESEQPAWWDQINKWSWPPDLSCPLPHPSFCSLQRVWLARQASHPFICHCLGTRCAIYKCLWVDFVGLVSAWLWDMYMRIRKHPHKSFFTLSTWLQFLFSCMQSLYTISCKNWTADSAPKNVLTVTLSFFSWKGAWGLAVLLYMRHKACTYKLLLISALWY